MKLETLFQNLVQDQTRLWVKHNYFVQGNYVNNELLCYLSNKIVILSHNFIVKIASDFYDEEIESAKTIPYDTCSTDSRLIFRKGTKKRQANISDMLSIMHEAESVEQPSFFALDLARLPPLDMHSVGVSGMMQEIKSIKSGSVS